MDREYTVESIPVNQNGQAVQADCVDISFFNYGTATLIVNNAIRVPAPAVAGQFNYVNIAGNVGEIDRTKYTCRFTGGGTMDAVIVRRNYRK